MYLGKLQVLALRNQLLLFSFKKSANTKKIVLFLSHLSSLGFEEKREVRKLEENTEQKNRKVKGCPGAAMHLLRYREVA